MKTKRSRLSDVETAAGLRKYVAPLVVNILQVDLDTDGWPRFFSMADGERLPIEELSARVEDHGSSHPAQCLIIDMTDTGLPEDFDWDNPYKEQH